MYATPCMQPSSYNNSLCYISLLPTPGCPEIERLLCHRRSSWNNFFRRHQLLLFRHQLPFWVFPTATPIFPPPLLLLFLLPPRSYLPEMTGAQWGNGNNPILTARNQLTRKFLSVLRRSAAFSPPMLPFLYFCIFLYFCFCVLLYFCFCIFLFFLFFLYLYFFFPTSVIYILSFFGI